MSVPTNSDALPQSAIDARITIKGAVSSALLHIKNGRVYDPTNQVNGELKDLWISNGQIIAAPASGTRPDRVIDASGMVVMPGGVDMHSHIAGPKVNAGRLLQPELLRPHPSTGVGFRSGSAGQIPTSFTTGYLYAGLGYTTAVEAAATPLAALQVHEEFQDLPILNKAMFVMAGNHRYLLKLLGSKQASTVPDFLAWLVQRTRAYAVKVVNPGGVEVWKNAGPRITNIDTEVAAGGVTPRTIIREISAAIDTLQLPHPMHIHCTNLGVPGNAETTLQTLGALEGRRAHLAHIQFHSYGGDPDDSSTMFSRVPELVEYFLQHLELTADIGQVMFGPATAMTGDSPLGQFLHNVTNAPWYSHDVECESGCGVVPIKYKQKSFVNALQFAIGLEWFLLMPDPWRISLTTDHPNGASFMAYPQIIALLMDKNHRDEVLAKLPTQVLDRCSLRDVSREYTLEEIAIITRAAPAKTLGLRSKGHLGIGADADVTIYQPNIDKQAMFSAPRYLLSGGEVVLDDGDLRAAPQGTTFHVSPDYDAGFLSDFKPWFAENYSLQFGNFGVPDFLMSRGQVIDSRQ